MKKETRQTGTTNTKTKKGSAALAAAAIGRAATQQVRRHSAIDAGFASTGANVSYEGTTAPGGGGSVGTGYASGQPAVGEKFSTNSDFEQNRGGSPSKTKKSNKEKDKNTGRSK